MTTQPNPELKRTVIAGRPVTMPIARLESPIEAARRRYGKPFAHERGTQHVHTQGPSYFTSERIAALAAHNEARRKRT